ncbi:MAG: hypothetical protein ACYC5M_18440 [Anaerolineae bacterium]
MLVGTARAAAIEWVLRYASRDDGFRGAYLSGSTIEMPDDQELSATSDIDVVVVVDRAETPRKVGKFVYCDALLEVTYLPWNHIASVEEVLASYHLAGSFRKDTLIADPTGELRTRQIQVSRHFAERVWVRRRCQNAMLKIRNGLSAIDPSAPLHDQVNAWLFSTGVTTHVLLVAALRNPTVRLRYLATRRMLTEYGYGHLYPDVLALLCCAHLTPQRVGQHLEALTRTFDATVATAKTPFSFSSDISAIGRPIAIDGSRDLIQSGYHHEAIFWIVATFARCHHALAADAPPDLQRTLLPAFEDLLADLNIASTHALTRRAEDVIEFLPGLWEIAENIMDTNPGIVDP